jgi:hypothetical protein
MIQRVIGAHRHQDVPGRHANARRREFGLRRQIELIQFHMRCARLALADSVLGNLKNSEQQGRKSQPGDRRIWLGEKVDDCNSE